MFLNTILSSFLSYIIGHKDAYSPATSNAISSSYDYIVVGAGSAGSVIASRLSEDACVSVLLLEAGGTVNPLSEIPAAAFLLQHTAMDWAYKTVPQIKGAYGFKNSQLPCPRGKGLGGSSLLNFFMYVRGNKRDFDDWDAMGAKGWSYKDVLPYFRKSEDNTDEDIYNRAPGYHGKGGYLTVSSPRYSSALMRAFAKASGERGYSYIDINGENQTGFSKLQGTLRNGRRCSTSKAFLVPAQNRKNLNIVDNAFVRKILINKNKEAYGVQFEYENKVYTVTNNKEIILSGGTVNSPQLLMLSGIGPKEHLRSLNITVRADLPVGDNYQDHIGTTALNFEASRARALLMGEVLNPLNYAAFRSSGSGPLTSFSGIEGMAYINTKYNNRSLDWPDVEIHMASGSPASDYGLVLKRANGLTDEVYNQVYAPYSGSDTFTFFPAVLRPKSRGTIRLKSRNPRDYPLIDPNIFQHPSDLLKLVEVMKECVNIVTKTQAFKEIGAKMFQTKFPGCEAYPLYTDSYLRCVARRYPYLLYHPVGTCKMGSIRDKTAVVDNQLRVIGIKNLRVADGSIMPNIVSGNTNAPIIMIGEKASDMIKAANADRLRCRSG